MCSGFVPGANGTAIPVQLSTPILFPQINGPTLLLNIPPNYGGAPTLAAAAGPSSSVQLVNLPTHQPSSNFVYNNTSSSAGTASLASTSFSHAATSMMAPPHLLPAVPRHQFLNPGFAAIYC